MEKKYELIKGTYSLYRVKALKDFTLITGETIKKGDFGGFVKSEDCLGQEGNCWIMDDAYVEGQVSGNAVIKDFAIVNGRVSENAVVKDCGCVSGNVSGNAIVKDHGFVGTNATATDNAIVQACQRIRCGTVTTGLLGTKDWTGALYAELGVVPKNGKIILYKRVWSTDNPKVFESNYDSNFIYEIGKYVIEKDVNENIMEPCGKGLHFTSLEFINEWDGNIIIECKIDLKDILTIQYSKIRARKCRVIKTIEEEQ